MYWKFEAFLSELIKKWFNEGCLYIRYKLWWKRKNIIYKKEDF